MIDIFGTGTETNNVLKVRVKEGGMEEYTVKIKALTPLWTGVFWNHDYISISQVEFLQDLYDATRVKSTVKKDNLDWYERFYEYQQPPSYNNPFPCLFL